MKKIIALLSTFGFLAAVPAIADQHSGEVRCLTKNGCFSFHENGMKSIISEDLRYSAYQNGLVLSPGNSLVEIEGITLTNSFDPEILDILNITCWMSPSEILQQLPRSNKAIYVNCGIQTEHGLRDLGDLLVYLGYAQTAEGK